MRNEARVDSSRRPWPTGLLEDGSECPPLDVPGVNGDCHDAGLDGVDVMGVATFLISDVPSIVAEAGDHFSCFHWEPNEGIPWLSLLEGPWAQSISVFEVVAEGRIELPTKGL